MQISIPLLGIAADIQRPVKSIDQSTSGTGKPLHIFIFRPCSSIALIAFSSLNRRASSSETSTKSYVSTLDPSRTPYLAARSASAAPKSTSSDSLTPKTASVVSYGSPRRYNELPWRSRVSCGLTYPRPHANGCLEVN